MPVSRHESFVKGFELFMKRFFRDKKLHYLYHLRACHLWNSADKCVHGYSLDIPDLNSPYDYVKGEYTETKEEQNNKLKLMKEFEDYFNDYFKQYISTVTSQNGEDCISKVTLLRLSLSGIKLDVIYYRNLPLPFPIEETVEDILKIVDNLKIELEKEGFRTNELRTKLAARDTKILKMQSKINTMEKQEQEIQKMQTKINTMVEQEEKMIKNIQQLVIDKTEDVIECMVCYENREKQYVVAPVSCLHIICKSCYIKCDICPVCRDSYYHVQKSSLELECMNEIIHIEDHLV
jgi:hypothetical protein